MSASVTSSKNKAADMVQCPYNRHHRVPATSLDAHKARCWLRTEGYTDKDKFLPEVFDPDAPTVVKLSPEEIEKIIEEASKKDPLFKRGARAGAADAPAPAPLTAERLLCVYTPDERRAIHDAAVKMAAMPQVAELIEVTLPGSGEKQTRPKTRLEVLAELRNMKRRRTKYRVATKSKNYSEVLREMIKGQMELFAESQPKIQIKQEKDEDWKTNRYNDKYVNYPKSRYESNHDYESYRETSRVRIKRERESSEEISRTEKYETRKSNVSIHGESGSRDCSTEMRTRESHTYEDDRYIKSSKSSNDKYDRTYRHDKSYRYKYNDYGGKKNDYDEQSFSHKSDVYHKRSRSGCDNEGVDSSRDHRSSHKSSHDAFYSFSKDQHGNRKRNHDEQYDKKDASYKDNRNYYKDDYDRHKKLRNDDYKKNYHHSNHRGKSREKSRVHKGTGDYSRRDKASEKKFEEKGHNFQSYWAHANIQIKKEKSDDSSSS